MVLVFFDNVEATARCAIEVCKKVRSVQIPFNPISNLVVHVLVDGHVCGDVVHAKFAGCPGLGAASFFVVFVNILAVSQRRAICL